AAIDYLPAGRICREPRAESVPPDEVPLGLVSWGPFGDSDNRYFKLHLEFVRPGQTFAFTARLGRDSKGDRYQKAVIRLASCPVARCVEVPGGLATRRWTCSRYGVSRAAAGSRCSSAARTAARRSRPLRALYSGPVPSLSSRLAIATPRAGTGAEARRAAIIA